MGGQIELATCPREQIDSGTLRFLSLACLYKKGLPPVTGGSLDQTIGFVEACNQLWADESAMRSPLLPAEE